MNSKKLKAALVTMPFAPAEGASIQLGILRACLGEAGIKSDDYYFNIRFFQEMRGEKCHHIYNSTLPSLVSEWFFSPAPFPRKSSLLDIEARQRLEAFAANSRLTMDRVFDLKEEIAPRFIEKVMEEVDWSKYAAVLFTLSYAQVNASFALAKKIKERYPQVKTIFGGAFSQIHETSIPEFMRVYDFIDYFILGEAEPVIAPLVKDIMEEREPESLPGLYCRSEGIIRYTGGVSILEDMDKSPVPDYSGFFEFFFSLPRADRILLRRYLPLETARGCYWGQHKPCSFCAFYPCGAYRPKSPGRLLEEVKTQIEKYHSRSFYVTDAAVTNRMVKEVFSRFPEIDGSIHIPFMEVRTNMGEEYIKILKQAGVNLIQPGIEALDDGILKKMNKGVTLFSNLLFMRNCRKHNIGLSYNIILGFPDVNREELEGQLEVIRKVIHLAPPRPMPLSLVRFSDYYRHPEKYPIKRIEPDRFYRYVFPVEIDPQKVAFEYSVELSADLSSLAPLYRETWRQIQKWLNAWNSVRPPFLELKKGGDKIIIRDGRKSASNPVVYEYEGISAEIYLLCMNRPGNLKSLKVQVSSRFPGAGEEEIKQDLEEFEEKGLMITRRGLSLSLAVDDEKPR